MACFFNECPVGLATRNREVLRFALLILVQAVDGFALRSWVTLRFLRLELQDPEPRRCWLRARYSGRTACASATSATASATTAAPVIATLTHDFCHAGVKGRPANTELKTQSGLAPACRLMYQATHVFPVELFVALFVRFYLTNVVFVSNQIP